MWSWGNVALNFPKSYQDRIKFGYSFRQSSCPNVIGFQGLKVPASTSLLSRSIRLTTSRDRDHQQPDRKPSNWWRNLTEVKRALMVFNERVASSTHDKGLPRIQFSDGMIIPSENILRAYPGGMELINAIRKHGGFKAFRTKMLSNVNSSDQIRQIKIERIDMIASGDAVRNRMDRLRFAEENQRRHVESTGAGSRTTGGLYARFLKNESWYLKEQLIAFNNNYTNNRAWNVMPSLAQLRAAKRIDLINAIDRGGGR
jgi:hypothetical protein